jgi:lysophospholipid acyltransferase (LPLAT)-like uncharacterized protein
MLAWLKMTLVPPIGASVIRLLGRALRLRTEGAEQVDELYRQGGRVIIAFWHNQQLMMPLAYRGTEAHLLISQHRDGELIHRIVERFGFRSVRGSTTRGGPAALRQLIRLGRAGVDLVVTPDGPRGPRHVAQLGVVQLAKATGLPILPLAFGCSKKKSFRVGIDSWFRIPLAEGCSSGASRSTSRRTPLRRSWKPNVWNWRARSIGSRLMQI